MVKKIISRVFVFTMLLVMYAPILVLIIYSFTDSQNLGDWQGFSFRLYASLFKNVKVMEALKNTIMIALSSATVSTILGTIGAIGIFYSSRKVRDTYETVGQIPVLNPEIVTALSLVVLFVFVGIKTNFITLLIGHVVLTIPFVVLSVTPKLKQMDPSIYEAALDLGAKPATALRRIILPDILPGVLSGFILSVTLSLDDYIITAFTRNDSFNTLSTYIYGLTSKRPLPPSLRALTTLIFIVTLAVLVLMNLKKKEPAKRKVRI